MHKTEALKLKSELAKLQELRSELEKRLENAEKEKNVSLDLVATVSLTRGV